MVGSTRGSNSSCRRRRRSGTRSHRWRTERSWEFVAQDQAGDVLVKRQRRPCEARHASRHKFCPNRSLGPLLFNHLLAASGFSPTAPYAIMANRCLAHPLSGTANPSWRHETRTETSRGHSHALHFWILRAASSPNLISTKVRRHFRRHFCNPIRHQHRHGPPRKASTSCRDLSNKRHRHHVAR
jgi:hypothetical protein